MNGHCEYDAGQGANCVDRCAHCVDHDANDDCLLANDDGSLKKHGGAADEVVICVKCDDLGDEQVRDELSLSGYFQHYERADHHFGRKDDLRNLSACAGALTDQMDFH